MGSWTFCCRRIFFIDYFLLNIDYYALIQSPIYLGLNYLKVVNELEGNNQYSIENNKFN